MDDPNLTERLYQSGATFSKDIEQTMSPIMSFLLTFILPMVIFIVLGQYLGRKLLEQAGGKNSMAFGMGKSNARVYVQSTEGIHFDDVAGEDEARKISLRLLIIFIIQKNILMQVPLCLKVCCL